MKCHSKAFAPASGSAFSVGWLAAVVWLVGLPG